MDLPWSKSRDYLEGAAALERGPQARIQQLQVLLVRAAVRAEPEDEQIKQEDAVVSGHLHAGGNKKRTRRPLA